VCRRRSGRIRSVSWLYLVPFVAAGVLMAWPAREKEQRSDQRVTITYWEKWSGDELQAIRDCVARYNDTQGKHDGVYVKLVNVSRIQDKFMVAVSGGNPPDVAGLFSFDISSNVEQNALLPLDEVLAEHGITPDRYIPHYWQLCRHQGRTWCLPTAPGTISLFWNKKLFREAGLDPERPPRTIEELDRFARQLSKTDPGTGEILQAGFLPSEPGWYRYGWGWWFGGRLVDGRGHVTATDAGNVRALQWAAGYVRQYGANHLRAFKTGLGKFSSPENGFFTGQVAMELQGVWFPNFIRKYAPGLEYGVAVFPSASGAPGGITIADADVVAIPRGAKHVREAGLFLKYMASAEALEILCGGQGKHSPLAETSDGFLDPDRHKNPHVRFFWKLAFGPGVRASAPIGVWREYKKEMNVAFDRVWNGEADPAEALQAVQQRITARQP